MMKLLYSADTISSRIKDLAETLGRNLENATIVHTIVTMNGACIFAADLCRQIHAPQILHFTGGSYFQGGIKQEIAMDSNVLPENFQQAPVIVVEDIIDSGNGIRQLKQELAERGAGQIIVVSLFKRVGSPAEVDYCAFSLPREYFVIGYGLDMDGRFRELPSIYTLQNTIITKESGRC